MIFIPELLRAFEIFRTFEKQKGVIKLAYKSCFTININIAVGLEHKVLFTDFDYHIY